MSTALAVHRIITVEAPQTVAFRVFTEELGTWWPLDTHSIGPVPAATAILEPRLGGRWLERGVDGTETPWGRVVAFEPPARLVLTWEISADWHHDPSLVTEVEVRFTAEGPSRTRVDLEHRDLDRYGARAREMQAIFDSPGGWPGLLSRFGARAG